MVRRSPIPLVHVRNRVIRTKYPVMTIYFSPRTFPQRFHVRARMINLPGGGGEGEQGSRGGGGSYAPLNMDLNLCPSLAERLIVRNSAGWMRSCGGIGKGNKRGRRGIIGRI